MNDIPQVPVPEALKQLIISNNTLLQNYQHELTTRVQMANMELMKILGLNPEDGWKLDMTTMMYVKQNTLTELDDS